ncbi:hypothetical protein Bca4012_026544 [Brassica carinata]
MADHCMVIPGEWTTVDSLWDFVIDKKKMSRIVPVRPGMSLVELQNNVAKEFFTFTIPPPLPVLSYWPPNSKELATGLSTPPVILTNDGAISYFFHHLAAHPNMNLFVTLKTKEKHASVDVNEQPFSTPNQPIKPNLNSLRPTSTASSKFPSFFLFDEDELLQDMPLCPPNQNSPLHSSVTCPSTEPSKIHRVCLVDETLTCGDEMLEEMFKENPDNIPDSWLINEEETDPESSQPPDIDSVPVRGYDREFWEPLLEETLGGYNAAEVMAGIHVPKTAPETHQCTTGDAFDHTVRLSGEDDTDWKKDLDFLGVHQKECTPVQT